MVSIGNRDTYLDPTSGVFQTQGLPILFRDIVFLLNGSLQVVKLLIARVHKRKKEILPGMLATGSAAFSRLYQPLASAQVRYKPLLSELVTAEPLMAFALRSD